MAWSRCCDTRNQKGEATGNTNIDLTGAPVPDPTDERGEEMERWPQAPQATAPLLDFTQALEAARGSPPNGSPRFPGAPYQTRGSPLEGPPTGAWEARSCCFEDIFLASRALAGAATPARTERAIRADTMVFMAFSHCRLLTGETIARCHDPRCYARHTSRKYPTPGLGCASHMFV